MRDIFAAAAAAVFALSSVGCNKSPEGGTPGTGDSFTLSGPTMNPSIKQGTKEVVTVTVNRKDDFKKRISFEAQAVPDKVKVTFDKATNAPEDGKEVKLTVDVDKEAVVGEHPFKIVAKPEAGKETALDLKVNVTRP